MNMPFRDKRDVKGNNKQSIFFPMKLVGSTWGESIHVISQ